MLTLQLLIIYVVCNLISLVIILSHTSTFEHFLSLFQNTEFRVRSHIVPFSLYDYIVQIDMMDPVIISSLHQILI